MNFQVVVIRVWTTWLQDLYEITASEINDKTGGYVISFIPKVETTEEDDEGLDKTELFVLATLNTIQKYFKKDLNTRTLWFWLVKEVRNCNC
jgi:hypothetical protein